MLDKLKRPKAIDRSRLRGFADRLIDVASQSFIILYIWFSVTVIVLFFLNANSDSPGSAYRFCLSTASGDSCVMRPGIIIGDKVNKSSDKLLDYFGSVPERVQNKWRVWVMDIENSSTIELTVKEFYAWIDTVWHPLQVEA